ncbi:MAG: hypothetical protein HZB21_02330, partial [Deltaproteobacteria bacterium]|nr:hypothetical protein [Deltaproteobacteria bacterium]
MKRLYSFVEGMTLMVALAGAPAFAGEVTNSPGLRQGLMDSAAVGSLYSIDDYTTMAAPPHEDKIGLLERELNVFGVKDRNAVSIEKKVQGGRTSFIIKRSAKEPFAYRSPNLPAYGDIKAPEGNRIETSYSGIDMFEYVYALCNKENGAPVFVIPRRYGRFSRLTETKAYEAFDYLMDAGDGAPWVAACIGGSRKFFVENEMSASGENNTYLFYAGRGLEHVNFVEERKDASYLAGLASTGRATAPYGPADEAGFLAEMAGQVAAMEMDLVRTRGDGKYIGTYYYGGKGASCARVSIRHARKGTPKELLDDIARPEEAYALRDGLKTVAKEAEKVKVSYYKVCDGKAASLDNRSFGAAERIKNLF